jgi:hypothetical protein
LFSRFVSFDTYSLVDVQSCRESQYVILLDPIEGSDTFTQGFRVDPNGQQLLIARAREVGMCGTCTGSSGIDQVRGFRAIVDGTVIDLGNSSSSNIPTLLVIHVEHSTNSPGETSVLPNPSITCYDSGIASLSLSMSPDAWSLLALLPLTVLMAGI